MAYSFIESEQKGNYFHHAERMINEKRENRQKQVKILELKYKSNKDKNSTEN